MLSAGRLGGNVPLRAGATLEYRAAMSETVVQESMNETTAKIVFLFINDMEFALVIDASLDRSHLFRR
jgi:hypothetical protein